MKLTTLPDIFTPAKPILKRLEQAGFEAYFVGGCVRDTILGDPIHDIDIATSAYPQEVKALFKRTVDTGIEHGTVMILDHGHGYETTTFRTESGYQDYRRPDHVTFVRSLKEDLKRRDFTINALALKHDGTVVDLFDGLGDLKRHLIRAVGNPDERFHEDALRMMRAVRFASKLNFTIDPATEQGISDNAPLLAKIAVERTQVEFEKLLLGQNPQAALAIMLQTKLVDYCPELKAYHQVIADLAKTPTKWQLKSAGQAWGALLVRLPIDRAGISTFLKAWKCSNDLIKHEQKLVQAWQMIRQGQLSAMTMFQVGWAALEDANAVAAIDGQQVPTADLRARWDHLPVHDSHELKVNGGQLIKEAGIKPGPKLGLVIQGLLRDVVEGKVPNATPNLVQVAKQIAGKGAEGLRKEIDSDADNARGSAN